MIDLLLIGIGTGDPDHLTLQAVKALNRAGLILLPDKGAQKADLADLRREICAAHLTNPATRIAAVAMPVRDPAAPGYIAGVLAWHDAIASLWHDTIIAHLGQTGTVALLVWGDPALYDSSIRIADRLAARGLAVRVQVIPGLTSVQVLTAAHATALNELGAPFAITTGRHLREAGFPAGTDTAVVMLDGECSFLTLPGAQFHIHWGAYLGMPQQILMAGALAEAGPRIAALRAEARARHGWIMDVYLLRRLGRS